MYQTHYHRASSIDDAAAAFAKGSDAKFLAGGQTLLPVMKQRLAAPSDVIDLAKIPALVGIEVTADRVVIKAATTHYDVATNAQVQKAIPALAALAGMIGDPAVRYRGTIGGSLANNDPSACYPAAALGSGATIVTDKREIAADDYFTGLFETALDEGEIITAVRFPIPDKAAYLKFEQPASRFALVGVFVSTGPAGVRVAVTGASEEGVFRWADAEAALSDSFAPEALDGLKAASEGLIGDIHGSPEYRAHLIGVLTKRAVAAAA